LALLEGNKRHPKMLPMLLGRSQAARSVVVMDNLLADPDATVRRPPARPPAMPPQRSSPTTHGLHGSGGRWAQPSAARG
jgi:hypothetical protein